MIKEMAKDESYLFKTVSRVLYDYADIPWHLGDEDAAILLGTMGGMMHAKYLDVARAKKRTKKSKRRA
jgi:hypothetical protein